MEKWIINPRTGRPLKDGSITHRRLINQGIMNNTTIDKKQVYVERPGDDMKAIIAELKRTTNLAPNETLKLKDGVVRIVFKGGRYAESEQRKRYAESEQRKRYAESEQRKRYAERTRNERVRDFLQSRHNAEDFTTETETETQTETDNVFSD